MTRRIFGYSTSASRLVICEREAEIVGHLFRAYADNENPAPPYVRLGAVEGFDGQHTGEKA